MSTEKIYNLKLHESVVIEEETNSVTLATRVPGGWIYEFQKPLINILETVFVPFNNEFQVIDKTEEYIF